MIRRRILPGIVTVSLLLLAGCNYVHFGRLDHLKPDRALAAENSDLRLQKKLLQQELAIAHKEGDALRAAVENRPAAGGSDELAAKLKETTRELTELRASYTRLQAQRERGQAATPSTNTTAGRFAAAEQMADLRSKLGETEDRLAEALRNYTNLQAENQKLRTSIDAAQAENATLAQKLDQVTTQNNEARSALAQLNTEFLAQKEARAQAEQAADALRSQLHAITASANDAPTSLAAARESSAGGAREIEAALQAPRLPNDASASARLSTSRAKVLGAGAAAPAPSSAGPAPAPASTARTYIVQEGDSLEKIAQKFYGRADRWSLLYSANNALLSGGRPLTAGMKLEIPEE